MSNKLKESESLHTLSNEDQAKAMQKLMDDKEAEHEMAAYNIADIINLLPDKYKTSIVDALNNYIATGKEPYGKDCIVLAYLGVAIWEAIKRHIDTLQAKGECPTNH